MASDTNSSPRDLEIPVPDGLMLSGRFWTVAGPRGTLVIAHGLGEHGGAYAHVADTLRRAAGVDVLAFDFRGHGRSLGRRGVVRRYEELCDDLRAAVAWAERERPDLPRFVLGHSNGGLVLLRTLLDGGLGIGGIILSNPALRVASPVPLWKRGVGRVLRRVAPRVTLDTAVDLATLTRDPVMLAARRDDPLRHSRINGPLFFGLVEGGHAIYRRAAAITTPALLVLGGSDSIIDAAFTSDVFDRLGSLDKSRVTFSEALHEPLNDLDRAAVLDVVARWLDHRLPAQ